MCKLILACEQLYFILLLLTFASYALTKQTLKTHFLSYYKKKTKKNTKKDRA